MCTSAGPTPDSSRQLDFGDYKTVYKTKSTQQLMLALAVLQFSAVPGVASFGHSILKALRSTLGDALVLPFVERTFYKHFCAGADQDSISPTIAELRAAGVGSILDYAAEEDVPDEAQRDLGVPEDVLQARTHAYVGEAQCDENMAITLKSIATASALEGDRGFAAVKVTALGVPEALQHLSQVLVDIRTAFLRVADGAAGAGSSDFSPPPPESADSLARAVAGVEGAQTAVRRLRGTAAASVDASDFVASLPLHSATLSRTAFLRGVEACGMALSKEEASALFDEIDSDGNGRIDYVEWLDYCNPRILGGMTAAKVPSSILPPGAPTKLSPELQGSLDAMLDRAEALAKAADEAGVTIMFDAEQTYMQPAIDHIVWFLQRKYNVHRPVVFNTYQAYLRDCPDRLALALDKADKHGYKFGAKLVRGAYKVQESLRAEERGYPNPIQPGIHATHASYDWCLRRVMDSIAGGSGAQIMVASHNEASIQRAVDMMGELGIRRSDRAVYFGQLLGMCDHASFTLGAAGYAVYKYVPYGPVGKTIPYLTRRAQENGDLLAGAGRERALMRRALWHRASTGER